jgi:hypothetical protein
MALETRICQCGQEYEQSEWSVAGDCEVCRTPTPRPLDNLLNSDWYRTQTIQSINNAFAQADLQQSVWTQGINTVGDTYTIRYQQSVDGSFHEVIEPLIGSVNGR